ncbi:MAG: glutamate ligase domain-containing protein, partial [Spirochaetia bacterium]
GHTAEGGFRIHEVSYEAGKQVFRLEGVAEPFELPVPGRHNQLNAAAALAAVDELCRAVDLPALRAEVATAALAGFRGTKRRAEHRGEHRGVLFMDDYGHHPTAITGTLEGLREFFPGRRLVVDFMSHTFSRTEALLQEFATCFAAADLVILHKIYASAREQYDGSVDGHVLYHAVSAHHAAVQYFEEPLDAVPYLREVLQPGDLFVTLGAGDNWRIIDTLLELPEFSSLGAP